MTPREPANDNFKTRVRSVTDKRTGNKLIHHDFKKQRHSSVEKFVRQAAATVAAADNANGIAAYFICTFDNDMMPTVCTFIDDPVPVTNAILVAAVTEALRHRLVDYAIDTAMNEEEPPPSCA